MPINLISVIALHQMVFALLTPIAIEPVIAELDLAPSLVMLGVLGSAKQEAEEEYS